MKHLKNLSLFEELKSLTNARIGVPTTGVSANTRFQLEMQVAQARAKDAIFYPLQIDQLRDRLGDLDLPSCPKIYLLESEANDRSEYLQRPDKGRKLSTQSVTSLEQDHISKGKINFIIGDGLSPLGVERYSASLIKEVSSLLPEDLMGDIFLCRQARVAIGDHIGSLCEALISIVIIGERPGFTTYDSVGIYLTYGPRLGRTDADRNCISNICDTGLKPKEAASRLNQLIKASLSLKLSGTQLKESVWNQP